MEDSQPIFERQTMQLKLDREQEEFVRKVRAFLAEHWPDEGWRPGRWRRGEFPEGRVEAVQGQTGPAFLAALAQNGWSVPDWPVEAGGTAWSPAERYLFRRELATAGAPEPDSFAVDVLGPWLLAFGGQRPRAHHVPLIRDCRADYQPHVSLFSDLIDVPDGPPLELEETASGWGLRHCLREGPGNGWLVARALARNDDQLLVLIDPRGAVDVLGDGQAIGQLKAIRKRAGLIRRARASHIHRRLDELCALIYRQGLDSGGELEERRVELEVMLLGLDALEQRVMLRGEPVDAEAEAHELAACAMVRVRAAEAAQEVARFALEVLGYYGLPAPDPLLHHNEGDPGPGSGQRAIAELFRYVGGLEFMADRDLMAALKLGI